MSDLEPWEGKFEHPVLDDVHKALEALEVAKQALQEAKDRLHESVNALPSMLGGNEELKDEIISSLYWFYEEIPAGWLKETFQLKVLSVPPIQLSIICTECEQEFFEQITSLSDLQSKKSSLRRMEKGGYPILCTHCKSVEDKKRKEWSRAMRQKEEARLQELKSMPYYDYLRTEEWQERRKKALKRAGFRCQVCNIYGVRLNVHHRTYERRGEEDNKDLITLCKNCHTIFHENGKLASYGEIEEDE